ncbi:MAG: CBS domain-containing protein, partial [Deltaproteobacteria bacterium]
AVGDHADDVANAAADRQKAHVALGHHLRGAATCSRREKVVNALARMREDGLTRLICTDDQGALVGVLSLDDVARHEQFRGALAATEQDIAIARS